MCRKTLQTISRNFVIKNYLNLPHTGTLFQLVHVSSCGRPIRSDTFDWTDIHRIDTTEPLDVAAIHGHIQTSYCTKCKRFPCVNRSHAVRRCSVFVATNYIQTFRQHRHRTVRIGSVHDSIDGSIFSPFYFGIDDCIEVDGDADPMPTRTKCHIYRI